VPLEGLQLLVPLSLELVEPCLQRHHRLGPEPEHPNPGVLHRSLVGDDSGLQKYPQMPAYRGWGRGDSTRQFSRSTGTISEQFHDLAPGRIGERFEHGRDSRVEIGCHDDNS
jgi:hypothetical protein